MATKTKRASGDLFVEDSGQLRLVDKSAEQQSREKRRVECLGMTFDTEEARRNCFLERLRGFLADPEFRQTPGFPSATDDAILALSDPPFYTACPNPFLRELVEQASKRQPDTQPEMPTPPFTADVAASKADIVYTAHSYHTKVPPEAIATYIAHYTKPGDVILDFFSGSGMTALACRMVDEQQSSQTQDNAPRLPISIDLSPAATFITSSYLWPAQPEVFEIAARDLLTSISETSDNLYRCGAEFKPSEMIEYVLWVEALYCPACQAEVISENIVRATTSIGTADEFPCPHCGALVSKAPTKESGAVRLERRLRTEYDVGSKGTREAMRRVPVSAQVRKRGSAKGAGRRVVPLGPETRRLQMCESLHPDEWFPSDPLIRGERFLSKDCLESYGITRVNHFYLPRQLTVYARMWALARRAPTWRQRQSLLFFVQSNGLGMTVMNRYQPTQFGKETGGSQVNRYFSGTLYVPSMVTEVTPEYAYSNKLNRLRKAFAELYPLSQWTAAVSTQSATSLANIPDNAIDYVFVDPPFGRNLQYSELNQIWEAWLQVHTNREAEAVIDSSRNREIPDYSLLMRAAFTEAYRVLKPGRWMTVEFHNSSNAVWHAIQEALFASGFMVADVRALSKTQETYKQSRQGLMKQDLVISAYKPTSRQEESRSLGRAGDESVWRFVREHLQRLPMPPIREGILEPVVERQHRLLFDRMVAFFVQRAIAVPMSAPEFYLGLSQRFPCRDEMYFVEAQVVEYEKARFRASSIMQLEMFVHDEASAIEWIRAALNKKPQRMPDLQPIFMREANSWAKHERALELEQLLVENFLIFDGNGDVPSQIHAYLSSNLKELRNRPKRDPDLIEAASGRWYVPDPNKQVDLEKVREKSLLREFERYTEAAQKKLKQFRTEALRVGFKAAYDSKDYRTIVEVARKVPDEIIQEDETLLMYFDVASMRLGEE